MNTNSIEKRMEIKAPVQRVWRALADHVEFGKWFGVKLEKPFAVGKPAKGRLTIAGYEHVWNAVVRKMVPGKLFSCTWHPLAIEKDVDYSKETPTLVEFRLEKTAKGTLLTVTETGFDKIPAERRAKAFKMHSGGWAEQMRNIKRHVSKA
jgi:uncharacterized protein YndB with AHSA1/START domain